MRRRHFYDTAVRAFVNHGIPVGKTLDAAHIRAVEFTGVRGDCMAQLLGGELPHHFQCYRIKFQDTAVIALRIFRAEGRAGIGHAVAGPAAVVEYQQVAFPGQAFGDHVKMMLADDPAQLAELR